MGIKANPKSVGSNYPDRYEGKYDDYATITAVDVVKSEGTSNGSIAVHLKGKLTYDNGTSKTVHLVDWFGKRNKGTDLEVFAQQMLNRAVNAQLSAGKEAFEEEIEPEDARKVVKKIFTKLVGCKVFVHQYTPKNKKTGEYFEHPNINYLYGDDIETEIDDADDDDDDEELAV